MEVGRPWQADLRDRVALPVDRLLRAREPGVIREPHRAYVPEKRGLRFSRNAFAPSTRSSVVRSSVARSFSRRSPSASGSRSEEHTSELQSRLHLVCRLLLEKKKKQHLKSV